MWQTDRRTDGRTYGRNCQDKTKPKSADNNKNCVVIEQLSRHTRSSAFSFHSRYTRGSRWSRHTNVTLSSSSSKTWSSFLARCSGRSRSSTLSVNAWKASGTLQLPASNASYYACDIYWHCLLSSSSFDLFRTAPDTRSMHNTMSNRTPKHETVTGHRN